MTQRRPPKSSPMITSDYESLCPEQQAMVCQRLMKRTQTPEAIVAQVLRTINPRIKVIDKEMILHGATLARIEKHIQKTMQPPGATHRNQ